MSEYGNFRVLETNYKKLLAWDFCNFASEHKKLLTLQKPIQFLVRQILTIINENT